MVVVVLTLKAPCVTIISVRKGNTFFK